MKTPDEQVAESIISEFKKQGLLSDAGLEKIKAKLISGRFAVGEKFSSRPAKAYFFETAML